MPTTIAIADNRKLMPENNQGHPSPKANNAYCIITPIPQNLSNSLPIYTKFINVPLISVQFTYFLLN